MAGDKKNKNSLKIVNWLKKKSKGTGWGKITRQNDQTRLEKLLKQEGFK